MAEIRNLQNEFPIRVLKTYRDFYAFSEYSFTFALTTLHSIVVVLGDSQARELVFQIQNKDKKCLLTKYDFFVHLTIDKIVIGIVSKIYGMRQVICCKIMNLEVMKMVNFLKYSTLHMR